MRLWSLHPNTLDPQGLVALWREGLLAQKVLAGKTKGYRRHPQLERFQGERNPLRLMARYLHAVADEANRRGYSFDRSKILESARGKRALPVTLGQIEFEWSHLLSKLKRRSPALYRLAAASATTRKPGLHPLFRAVRGPKASWERG